MKFKTLKAVIRYRLKILEKYKHLLSEIYVCHFEDDTRRARAALTQRSTFTELWYANQNLNATTQIYCQVDPEPDVVFPEVFRWNLYRWLKNAPRTAPNLGERVALSSVLRVGGHVIKELYTRELTNWQSYTRPAQNDLELYSHTGYGVVSVFKNLPDGSSDLLINTGEVCFRGITQTTEQCEIQMYFHKGRARISDINITIKPWRD